MSYRAVKRLLGETSLERKCRFLFGGALMVLITGSFYLYAQLNLRVLQDQNRERARLVVSPRLLARHSKNVEFEPAFQKMQEELLRLKVGEDLADEYEFNLFKVTTNSPEASDRPYDQTGHRAVHTLREMERAGMEPLELVVEIPEKDEYRFYQGLRADASCLQCHYHSEAGRAAGDVIGVAEVKFPLSRTTLPVRRNNAWLIAMALLTASLAMLAAYVIVRYVIVKPVLHLQDVSDAIAHGDLDQRADIRTGDEFEELSHAFNRMLRHLVTVQDELRQVNSNLDKKVDELAQANLSLHEMNKMKGEFLATMSHELRTPLNSILGFSDVLAGAENITDKQRKFLSNIQASGQNLLTLINDILDLAKLEAAKMEVHIAEFDVAELIERLVGGIRPLAERKNIELRWEADERLPIANQDAGKLQQILDNLLSNAVKFTPEGGRILVQACYEPADWLVLVVADNGIGIPLDDQATIFEKFRQGSVASDGDDAMLTREYEGTGLGLSIVKELTRLLGGEVFLESEFGKGSTFSVRIPLRLESTGGLLEDSREHQTLGFRRSIREEATAAAGGDG
jgi:two-component system, NarL family, sensor histidine kinase BarA